MYVHVHTHTAHSLLKMKHRKNIFNREDMNIEAAQAVEGMIFDTEIRLETMGGM